MKRKLFRTILIGVVLLLVIGGVDVIQNQRKNTSDQQEDWIRNQLVAVSELEESTNQLLDQSENPELKEQFAVVRSNLYQQLEQTQYEANASYLQRQNLLILLSITFASILVLLGVYLYLCRAIFTPFERMKQYAGEIAAGNFDLPLQYERANYFGDFTWAFDAMRCEISRARASEQEQIENNKTVIATLTHDIMTPVASIRAYVEGMEASFDQSIEKRMHYLSVLKKKCDEVVHLCDDLFLHSLSDMDKLLVRTKEENLSELLAMECDELAVSAGDVHFYNKSEGESVYAVIDRKRFLQIIENLVNNARKYAKSAIDITLESSKTGICVTVRDYGPGIPDEDLPFITDKFYRGINCGEEKGSGLGLYIVHYLMGQMHGECSIRNREKGLEIQLHFSIK